MSQIFLNDDDVLSIDPGQNFTKTSTSTIKEVRNSLMSDWLKGLGNWMGDGVRCQVLFVDKLGWHKGRVRIRIEFVPDKPEAFIELTASDTKPESPLDDLRAKLNNE